MHAVRLDHDELPLHLSHLKDLTLFRDELGGFLLISDGLMCLLSLHDALEVVDDLPVDRYARGLD